MDFEEGVIPNPRRLKRRSCAVDSELAFDLLEALAETVPDRIVIDDRPTLVAARNWVARQPPAFRSALALHEGSEDIFEQHGVADDLAAAMDARVALPGAGALKKNGLAVTTGQFVSAADINSGKLKFSPAANANGAGYASFTFQVQDNGGTANGGVDLDQSANTITVDVTSVNDAPAGANNTVTTLEDTDYTFATIDFGFTDPNDSPANTLAAVKIATLPGAGTLSVTGGPA